MMKYYDELKNCNPGNFDNREVLIKAIIELYDHVKLSHEMIFYLWAQIDRNLIIMVCPKCRQAISNTSETETVCKEHKEILEELINAKKKVAAKIEEITGEPLIE